MNSGIILSFVGWQQPGPACDDAGAGTIFRARYRSQAKGNPRTTSSATMIRYE
jgi:hypothetical protein